MLKKTKYMLLMLLAVGAALTASAQQRNVLSVPDAKVSIGQAQLPVAIENTDEVVGAQFDLTLPSTISAGSDAVLASRCDGHTVVIRNMSATRYRVMLYSDNNNTLLGQAGTVFYIPLNIPQTVAEGSELPLVISDATLTIATGENVLTEAKAGKLIVSTLPDLTVNSVTAASRTIKPGEPLSFSWQVQNVGGSDTKGGWSEQVLLVNKTGTVTKLLGTVYQQETLAAGGVMSRQADIVVPQLLGIEGEAYVQVKVIANSDTGESALATGNNSAQADGTFTVSKSLFVEPSPARITEGGTQRIAVKVSRSGDWSGVQTFSLSATADSRVTLPATVQVEPGQSGAIIYMTVGDNTVIDNDSVVIITAQGNAYPDATGRFVIEDNEFPNLTLTASKTTITEGETFQLTVTTSRISQQPIEVTLSSENTKRFSLPATVTIPAGEASASVEVATVDDDVPTLELSNAFTAAAPRHNKAEVIVLLQDNDMPVLTLELTPNTVQESVGPIAIAGVLRRTTNTNSKIIVKLTDDANGGLYFGNRTLELAKGVEEVHFNFGPVDNANVDGDRTYTITAAVWLSSCSCGATGQSAGYVAGQVRVLDDDGLALGIVSSLSTVKEGGSTMLTIRRNTTDTSEALAVTLSSDFDEGINYNHSVTIPAGQQSTTVEVTSAANSVQGDSHTVVFTVQAEGYASGTCFIMVTDQTLPDARITAITANVSEAEVGSEVKLTVEVTNDGDAELPAEVPVKIYRRGETAALSTIYTSDALPIDGRQTLVKTITLPSAVGTYSYYAVVDEDNKFVELSHTNNTSQDCTVKAIAPFSVTVSTDKAVYGQGETIAISGQLTGNGTANAEVELYIMNEGARMVKSLTTDAEGKFTTEWEPYAQQSGHFTVGACYPSERLTKEMAAFDVYGLRRASTGYITNEVAHGETKTATVGLSNPGVLKLTGVKAEILSVPANCEATVSMPETIEGGQTVQMTYSLTGTEPSAERAWDEVNVRISTNEGVSLDLTLYFYCFSNTAKLVADVSRINTTITKGTVRDYPIQIVNTGKGASGPISLALPEWMSCASGTSVPSMEYNDTTTVILRMATNDKMQLNMPVTGTIGINCANGSGLTIAYSVEPVSEEEGTLVVDVCDEYTYNTAEAPHVAGAEVVVRHPYTNSELARGTTGTDGTFTKQLPEGYYKVTVSADKHEQYSNFISINPGKTEQLTVNISYQPITVVWNVEETEVEDEYEIITTVQYETNVPMPVVKVQLPERIDGDNMAVGDVVMVNMLLTNVGLINAQDVTLDLPTDKTEWKFEALAYNEPFVLAPQQMVAVPVKITRIADESQAGSRMRNAASDMVNSYGNCMAAMGSLYKHLCGTDLKSNAAAERMAMKTCAVAATMEAIGNALGGIFGGGGGGGGLGGPGGGPGGGGGGGGTSNYHSVTQKIDLCDPCDAARVEAGINAALGFTWAGPINDALDNAAEAAQMERDAREASQASGSEGGYGPSAGFYAKKIGENIADTGITTALDTKVGDGAGNVYSLGKGIYDVVTACNDIESGTQGNDGGSSRQQAPRKASKHSWMEVFDNVALEYIEQLDVMNTLLHYAFGDSVWYVDMDVEKAAFIKYVCGLSEGEMPAEEELLTRKPESVSLSQMWAYVNHIVVGDYDGPEAEDYEVLFDRFTEMNELSRSKGYDSMTEEFFEAYNTYQHHLENMAESSVCASITLQFKQTMTMTRQAFRGTLIVFNGHESIPMQDVKLNLEVKNTVTGEVATSHEFQVNGESLDGFSGNVELPGGWTLAANATGTATVLFIPTKYAAPDEPVDWAFGGTLTYIDPFTGLEVTRELYPVTLTVKPSPELDLDYFMQRDVYGDDPLTLDVVEPMVPAEFALIINNKGNGDATNVRMVTQQPEIIDNEKGLLIDFELISSQVNGGDATLSFGQSIANDFGTIPAHSQMYAQWWLTSTLLGHFTDYKVEATHVTSYGNEDLSLLDQVNIHELIHGFDLTQGGRQLRAFLVNDVADAGDTPDMIYLTDGTRAEVQVAANTTITKQSATDYLLTVTPSVAGWNYGSLFDPTHGLAELKSIVRQSDGSQIDANNIWFTDRTLLDGKEWLYENRLHFVDNLATGAAETYLLTFEPTPAVRLEVASISGIPAEDTIAEEPVDEVTVVFNKKIDAATFTADDLRFNVQGERQDESIIGISTNDNQAFKLDLKTLTEQCPNGYYTLTVQTADITDEEGFLGHDGKQVGWILFRGGLVQLLTSAWPLEAGSVSQLVDEEAPARGRAPSDGGNTAKYGSTVRLTAEASPGYVFSNWTLNGEVVSTDAVFEGQALSDMNVVANFVKKSYLVELAVDGEGGTLEGSATGIYEHGTPLLVTAVPDGDYAFSGWTVNGESAGSEATLELTADRAMIVSAAFLREFYQQTITMPMGWSWISTYMGEPVSPTEFAPYATRIMGQDAELISDPVYGMVGSLSELLPGAMYKVNAERRFSKTLRGRLYDQESQPLQLSKGWNWIGFPLTQPAPLPTATATDGDYIVGQTGFAEYADGTWEGTIAELQPGVGYLYKTGAAKTLTFDDVAGARQQLAAPAITGQPSVNVHGHPNTMSVTARVSRDGSEQLDGSDYTVYAFAGDELRGISALVGDNHYLTVYGDTATAITFLIEDARTGQTYQAREQLTFIDDVVGSRRTPFVLTMGSATGIDVLSAEAPMTVFTTSGVLVSRNATLKTLNRLPKGVYIVNGQKCFIK